MHCCSSKMALFGRTNAKMQSAFKHHLFNSLLKTLEFVYMTQVHVNLKQTCYLRNSTTRWRCIFVYKLISFKMHPFSFHLLLGFVVTSFSVWFIVVLLFFFLLGKGGGSWSGSEILRKESDFFSKFLQLFCVFMYYR